MGINIWLDDIRDAPGPDWIICRSADVLTELITNYAGNIDVISLDHDLGDGVMSGAQFLAWYEKYLYEIPSPAVPEIRVHSMNPVGRKNMQAAIDSIHRRYP